MKKMKVAELVLDFSLYPRSNVDSQNVANLCEAIAAGIELPPIVIDKASKRVADGFHRVKAYLRVHGDDAEAFVVEKSYRNEKELFLDAARYNAAHGAKLDSHDRTHCAIVAERLKIDMADLAGALNMTVDKLANLRDTRVAMSKSGEPLALKNTVRRQFAGKKLTKRQEQANAKFSGMNQAFYVNQLIELIESDMLDKENGELMERVQKLHELLLSDVFAVAG